MKFKTSYVVIPLITILVAFLGTHFTGSGMDWYENSLILPASNPPKWAFPIAWNLIFLCTTISAIILWNKGQASKRFLWFFKRENMAETYWWVIGLFIINAILNVVWSLLFFGIHNILAAFVEMIFLEATLFALIYLTWEKSKLASYLLVPYAVWVGFATFLTWEILRLNT